MKPVLEWETPFAAAHRGSRILWPENTMPAFQGAYDLGYRVIETDLNATSDGVLLTFHDSTLDRCTNRSGKVVDHSLADLADVDAAHHFDGWPDAVAIPTFEEVVTAFPDAAFILDMKAPDLEQLLADAIATHDLWDRVIVGSFSDGRTRRFRELTGGRVATSSGTRETIAVRFRSWMGRPSESPADVFQVPVRQGITVVDQRFVDAAHEAGKHVHVWTIDEEAEMRRLLEMGVDGIITDRPDTLKQVLGR